MTHDQHVVPQVYLKHFANGRMCYVIDSYGKIQHKSIEGICYEDDFYEFKASDGTIVNPNLAEHTLRDIETKYSDFLDDLLRSLDANEAKRFMLVEDNGLCLVTWIVIMLLRSPLVFKLTPEVAAELGIEWNDLQSHNNAILNISILTEEFSKKLFKSHKIIFIKNESDENFLTGNYPSLILNDRQGNLRGYMPLSPKYYVLLVDRNVKEMKEYSVCPAIKAVVNRYNREIIMNSLHIDTDVKHKYIISKDKETLEHYLKFVKKELSK